jgi:aromatic-L-amino-acid/L-tryptophan decarboxylase
MLWKRCPAATELEEVTTQWVLDWLGLTLNWFGMIVDSASNAVLQAVVAARQRAEPESRVVGPSGRLVTYLSEHTHSSVEKAAITAGIGQSNMRHIKADAEFRMRTDALAQAIAADRANNLKPFFAVGTIGSTSSAAIDPCGRYRVYLSAERTLVPGGCSLRGILGHHSRVSSSTAGGGRDGLLCAQSTQDDDGSLGLQLALYAPSGSTAKCLLAGGRVLENRCLRCSRLRRLWSCSWAALSCAEGMVCYELFRLRERLGMAAWLGQKISADDRFELLAPATMGLVCFRLRRGDAATRDLMSRINSSGRFFVSHTVLGGRFTIRVAIGNLRMRQADVDHLWNFIAEGGNVKTVPSICEWRLRAFEDFRISRCVPPDATVSRSFADCAGYGRPQVYDYPRE